MERLKSLRSFSASRRNQRSASVGAFPLRTAKLARRHARRGALRSVLVCTVAPAASSSIAGGKRKISLCCPDKRGVRPAHKIRKSVEDDWDGTLRNDPKTATFLAEFAHER